MEEFRLMVSGGKDFEDYILLSKWVDNILAKIKGSKEIIIVCGVSMGADMLGER